MLKAFLATEDHEESINTRTEPGLIPYRRRQTSRDSSKRADINTNMACRIAELSPVKVNKVMDDKQRSRPLMP